MTNALHTIAPYRSLRSGLWVFDDPERGLEQEPFIPLTGRVLDRLLELAGVPEGDENFALLFGAHKFPEAQAQARRLDNGNEAEWEYLGEHPQAGTWYEVTLPNGEREDIWLCPALLRYFERPPEQLFVQVVPKEREPEREDV